MKLHFSMISLDDNMRSKKKRIVQSTRLIQKSIGTFLFALLILSITSNAAFATSDIGNSTANIDNNSTKLDMPIENLTNSSIMAGNDTARNVILLIGDGMGDSEITIARNYELGADGHLVMDTFPFNGAVTTFSVEENNASIPNYVTDSAASGTAWSTGEKTSNGRISTTPTTDEDLKTILEIAQENGLGTGIVTTSELTDATPAVLASHVNDRDCQGPQDSETIELCPQDRKSTGGPGSIAEQMVDHKVDLLFGGGKERFDQNIDASTSANQSVINSAETQGYKIITTASELEMLDTLTNSSANTTRVLGLFAPENMNVSWTGEPAAAFPGSGPQSCVENQQPNTEPSLSNMTSKAIYLLDEATKSKEKGFFLQVESASIDKRDHDAQPCEQIGETIAFDKAIQNALDYASLHPDTLIIVTADHSHTSQIIPMPEEQNHPGFYSTLITKDGANMTINYATSPLDESQDHTGAQVSIAAQGPHAEKFTGLIDQTEIFGIMNGALFGNTTGN